MDYVATEVDGRVAVVTISNPPMNPLSAPLLEELTAEVERLDADDDVGAIVLRGGATCVRRRRGHQGVPEAARGDRGVPDGTPRGSFRWASSWRPRARPRSPRSRASASAAGSSWRWRATCASARTTRSSASLRSSSAYSGRGRDAAAAAPDRSRPGDAPEPHAAIRRRADGVRLGPRREGRAARGAVDAGLAIGRSFAAQSPHAIGVLKELSRETRDLPLEEGLRREAAGFARCLASEDGLEA